jgi:hypothetical protein
MSSKENNDLKNKEEKNKDNKIEEKDDNKIEEKDDNKIEEKQEDNKEENVEDNKEENVEDNKEENVEDNKEEKKEVTGKFNSKTAENTTKTLNKVNFSRSRELSDKYADRIVDSAERYGKKITIDKIKEKLGADLFRNLKQTSLKYFFDFVSKYSNTSIDVINDVFKSASIDLEEDGLAGVLSAKNRMRGNILLMFLLDRLNFALTNEETRGKLIETTELLQKFTNETFMAIVTTLQENKQLLEDTMENFRPIIREFIVTIVSAVIQGLMVAIAASGPIGAPANLWFQGSKVVNEVAPKLGLFAENVSNIIDKYDKMLASLSEKGEGPLQRFKEIKEKITGFTDMISAVQQDAALIDSMGKNV